MKKTLLFDASVIAENLNNGSGRSGIYFTAYNILKGLIKSEKFSISLYCGTIYNNKIIDFMHDNFGKDIKICFGNRYGDLIEKLAVLDKKLRANKHNITKLLLNIFVRKPIKFFGKFVKLPRFDIAFSPFRCFPDKIVANKKYILLHDCIPLLFPQYYPQMGYKKYWYYDLIQYIKSGKKCLFFANSISTKNDFVKLLNMNPDDIIVASLAAGDNFYHETDNDKIKSVCKKYNIPTDKKYVFSLCTLEPRKNLIRCVKTFIEFITKNKIKDMVFVLGGGHWAEFIKQLEAEIKDLGKYKNKIIQAGYIEDEDLSALYSGAEFFVYTSQYEGFGLPPLEAMKCGAPVIASNNSSIPEVVGDAAQTIDWDSDEQHIAAYEKYYFDKEYRESMAKKGLQRSKQFSWDKTVDTIINEMQKHRCDNVINTNSNECPIVLITDENYLRPTIVTITSILMNKHNNTKYKIYVFCNSLSEKSKKILSSINSCIEIIPFENEFSEFIGTHQHVSASALLKFKIADKFPQYDKILYLDTDMIIQHDLSELFDTDINDKYAAVVKDMAATSLKHADKRLNLSNYFNSGMMLLNIKKMREENICEKLIDYKLHKDTQRFMDQDCLNAVFNDDVVFLNCKYNYMPINQTDFTDEQIADFYNIPQNLMQNFDSYASVIHLTNKEKPWDYKDVYGNALWAKYYYKSVLKHKKIKYKEKPKISLKQRITKLFYYNRNAFYTEIRLFGLSIRFKARIFNKNLCFKKIPSECLKGFYDAESWGRWSHGRKSEILLPVYYTNKDLKIDFKLQVFALNKILNQKVDVFVKNKKIATWNFVNKKVSPKTEIVIPNNLLNKNGVIAIKFAYSKTISPKKLGQGKDNRNLAIGFESLKITRI